MSIFKKIYNLISKFYNLFSTFFENIFLKKKIDHVLNDYLNNGYCILELNKSLADSFKYKKIIKNNKYMDKFILDEQQINNLINYLFIESDLCKLITGITGFNYSIDFFIAYRTYKISKEDLDKGWYANHWHTDKPFSQNTLKIIAPLKNIENPKQGGIEIMNLLNSKLFQKNNVINSTYKMTGNTNKVLLFNPNLCVHRAGMIEESYEREQIMFQLNPSKNWNVNNDIVNKQYKLEPKFPFFAYFFNKKTLLS